MAIETMKASARAAAALYFEWQRGAISWSQFTARSEIPTARMDELANLTRLASEDQVYSAMYRIFVAPSKDA